MNVSCDIAKVAAPALYVLKLTNPACPTHLEQEEWEDYLDKMYQSMAAILSQEEDFDLDEIQEGCDLLGQYFLYLFK